MIRVPYGLPLPAMALAMTLATASCSRTETPVTDAEPVASVPVDDVAALQAQPVTAAPTLPDTPAETMPAMPPPATAATGIDVPSAASTAGWQFSQPQSQDGPVPTARIASSDGAVTLVLESHPVNGRKGYLQLPALPQCPSMRTCRINIQRDGGSSEEMMVSELTPPDSRLYLFDPRALWRSLDGVQTLRITYPAAAGPATAEFDVTGTDLSQMPRWSR